MNETVATLLALLGGVPLGLAFFSGLWWTVQKGSIARRPALWFLASFVARMGMALTGFYLMSLGHWHRLLCCLAGFVVARAISIHFLVPAMEKRVKLRKERSLAP